MKSLPYTTVCIKEAMRLYPPVPYYFREISEDITFKDTSYMHSYQKVARDIAIALYEVVKADAFN